MFAISSFCATCLGLIVASSNFTSTIMLFPSSFSFYYIWTTCCTRPMRIRLHELPLLPALGLTQRHRLATSMTKVI